RRSGGGRACRHPRASPGPAPRRRLDHRSERRRPARPGRPSFAGSDPSDHGEVTYDRLTRFLVDRMRTVPFAVLLHLDALTVILLVLGRDVVAALAGLTL